MTAGRRARSTRPAALAAGGVLLVGLCVTALVTRTVSRSADAESRGLFEGAVRRLEYEVVRRINVASYGLRGLAATYAAHGELTTTEFRDWVSSRDLATEFPGVRGFGLIRPVQRSELPAFIARQRESDPAFEVRTAGEAADLFVVTEVEPRAGNSAAWGYDLGQEKLRRDGIERAIATAGLALTDRVGVVQDGRPRAGWLMLLPVYRKGVDPQSAAGRKRALVGLVYAPMIAQEVLSPARRAVESQVDFRLYDGPETDGQLLFDSTDAPNAALFTGTRGGWDVRPFRATRSLEIGGQQLTLEVAAAPELARGAGSRLPMEAAAAGTLLSALLALLVWQLANGQRRARLLAESMTHDLRRAARELSANDAFLQQAQRIANIGGWEVELATLALRLSPQTLRLFDLPADAKPSIDEFIGFFVEDSRERIETATRDAVRDGTPWDLELELISAQKVERWVRTVGQVEREGGRSLRLIGTLQDITERRRSRQALLASEQMMRVVTDNMPGRVGYWDRDQRCVFANRVYGEMFGRSREEMIGTTLRDLLGEARYAAYRPDIDAALSGVARKFEREEQLADGATRTMFVHYIPDVQQDEVRGFFVLALDVTELKEAREAARQASAAKGQFLANTSHELRTPMNAIIGMLTLLRDTPLTTRQADYVQKAEGAARSLLGLLNDILDFSKIEAGKLTLDPRPFKLDELLRDLSVILAANLRSDAVEVLFDIDPSLPQLLVGDDMRLRQVLINLGGNAVKFTERGEVLVSLRQVAREGGHVRVAFSVRDTGIGITPEQQARIFEGFSQAEASTVRKYGGTGLGLAISQRLVSLMGSRLELESEPGRGSRFHFTVDLPVGAEAPRLAQGDAASTKLRVLFIDDNPVALRTMTAQAEGLGWHVDAVPGAHEAIAAIAAAPAAFDAIFVDWRMPQIDGLQAVEMLRKLPQVGQSTLLIMVTAHGRARFDAVDGERRSSVDGYLVKPVTASMLRDSVLEASGRAPRTADSRAKDTQPLAGVRILVAEDNRNNQQVARELLGARGATVVIAEDGAEALSRVTGGDEVFDAVLMDVQMPVMDGYTATREIRKAGLRELPVIAMTANAMAGDREECIAAGMNDHVGKPFDIDDLVATILRHVRGAGDAGAAAEPRPTAPAPDVDVAAAVRRLGGDLGFFRQIYSSMRADATPMIDRLGAGAPAEEAERLLHTLKGLAGTVGASAFARVAAEGEAAVKSRGEAALDTERLEGLRAAYELACAEVDKALRAFE